MNETIPNSENNEDLPEYVGGMDYQENMDKICQIQKERSQKSLMDQLKLAFDIRF